jgi:dihydroflavonol-4-reductase
MRLLLTGATGFVGGSVARAALAAGHTVRAVARDPKRASGVAQAGVEVRAGTLTDPAAFAATLEGVDVLIHAAATYAYGRSDGERMIRDNPAITEVALEGARRAGTPHTIDVSSAVVFKPHPSGPRAGVTDVDSPRWQPGDVHWDDPYLRSKVLCDAVVARFRRESLPVSSIHPTSVIGPGDGVPGTSGAILIGLSRYRLQVEGALGWNDVRDLAAAVLAVAGRAAGGRYLVTAGTRTLREMSRMMDAAMGRHRRRVFIPRPAARAMASLNDRFGGRLAPRMPPRPSLEYLLTTGPIDGSSGLPALGLRHRPLEASVADAFEWWASNGMLPPPPGRSA